ncbi:sensor domain-containing protein [Natronorubrum daqingense]|uniref:Putative sensor n=1 Tax=Natronorubrum daqingense TaxID=588898 RepID=A0A1N7AR27_9EURY|nr:sensor domain-containing protein [Natronorubrum daqingense]APX97903.1 hypothetical protein BB347_15510 [Natronorubrum daqingense]SIR41438.1 Putative sensor [Natronorubrum daqingense]
MSDGTEPDRPNTFTRAVLATALSPFRRQTYANLCYLLFAIPLGAFYITFLIAGLSIGLTLALFVVGVPILLFVLGTSHVFAIVERVIARRLLGVHIDSPNYPFLEADDELERIRSLVFNLGTYMAMCFLATKAAIGLVSLVVVTAVLLPAIAVVLTPLYYARPDTLAGFDTGGEAITVASVELPVHELLFGVEFVRSFVEWGVTSLPQALVVSSVGIVCFLLALSMVNLFARLVGQFSRVFLGSFGHSSLDR